MVDVCLDDLFLLDRDVTLVPQAHTDKAFPRHLPITEELCYFLGWYAAEGTMARRTQVALSLGEADERYLPSIIEAIERTFGGNARIHVDRRHAAGRKLYFHSALATRLITALGLHGHTHEKRVPDLLFNVSEDCQLAFLEGYFLGDGSKSVAAAALAMSTVSAPSLRLDSTYSLRSVRHTSTSSLTVGGRH